MSDVDPTLRPVSLSLVGPGQLQIAWSDGQHRQCDIAELRRRCPCATCLMQAPPETPAEQTPALGIVQMSPVGNYGYKIVFSDGHDTGIFPLELLRDLGKPA